MGDQSLLNTARSVHTVSSSINAPLSVVSDGSVVEELDDQAAGSVIEDSPRSRDFTFVGGADASPYRDVTATLQAAVLPTLGNDIGVGVELEGIGEARSFGGASGHADSRLDDHIDIDDDVDEGVVSVMGFDSHGSAQSSQVGEFVNFAEPHARGHFADEPMDETASVWGFGDTVESSNSLAQSESFQQSANTVFGETLGSEGGDGGIAGMLHRLALENLTLDESLTQSVRRVIQLGTVLTGERLSDAEIHALPQVRFESQDQSKCAICLELYQRGEFLTSLRCRHFFHVDCLARWFRRSTQCPLCRSECSD